MNSAEMTTANPTESGAESLLLTGQFWHNEFADLVNGLTVPTTLMRAEPLMELREWTARFGMILVCKERRGAISQALVDQLKVLIPKIPIVVLMGSWCEGESRSGTPLTGVTHVYWHQWHGNFKQLQEFAAGQKWPIATSDEGPEAERDATDSRLFAVSALTLVQYEMIADAVGALGGKSVWLERSSWQAEPIDSVKAIIVDSDSLSECLTRRVSLAKSLVPHRPVICTMGFPRKNEVQELYRNHGVGHVVSKPFEMSQLYHAIRQATGIELPCIPNAILNDDVPKIVPSSGIDAGSPSISSQQQTQ